MGFIKKSRIIILAILVIIAGFVPATAQELDDTIEDSGIYDNGKEKFANINTTFQLGAQDNISTVGYVEYKIDDDQFQKYAQPIKFTSGGPHLITYRSVDGVGNKEQDKVFKIIIDDAPPSVFVIPSGKLFSNTTKKWAPPTYTYELKAKDKLSGMKKIQYSLDGGELQDYAAAIQVGTTGVHKIKFRAEDNVGNISAEETFVWNVDANKPKVKIKTSPKQIQQIEGKAITNSKTLFIIKSKDKHSGIGQVLFQIDGGAWTQYTSPISFPKEKEYILNVKAVDNVGNTSGEVNKQFQIDNDPPKTTLTPVTQ